MPKLGKKMLSLQPLAKQFVAPDDSVLGPLSSGENRSHGKGHAARAERSLTGLDTTYARMIQAAFRPEWWRSPAIVTYDAAGSPSFSSLPGEDAGDQGDSKHGGKGHGKQKENGRHDDSGDGSGGDGSSNPPRLTTGQYSVMEANFSLFFGLSVQLYLSTLVADDTPFDRFLDGRAEALTAPQQAGLQLFFGKAGCARCHAGPELTEASFSQCAREPIDDDFTTLSGVEARYDKGFINTGVRPVGDDPGIGGSDPFGSPLADTRRLKLGLLPPGAFNLDVGPQDPIAVDGAFKIPGLRSVELTAPYFHNGGMATLEQVVEFYNRGGDFGQQDRDDVRDFMRPLGLTTAEQAALVAFLKSLTDERVRYEQAPFDHPQIFVPNGHPTFGGHIVADEDGRAVDDLIEIRAVGAGGGAALQPVF